MQTVEMEDSAIQNNKDTGQEHNDNNSSSVSKDDECVFSHKTNINNARKTEVNSSSRPSNDNNLILHQSCDSNLNTVTTLKETENNCELNQVNGLHIEDIILMPQAAQDDSVEERIRKKSRGVHFPEVHVVANTCDAPTPWENVCISIIYPFCIIP